MSFTRKAACEVIVITCTNNQNEDDKAILGMIKEIVYRDQDQFRLGYALEAQCNPSIDGETQYLFVAIEKDPKMGIIDVCGFANVVHKTIRGYPEIKVMASKAFTNREAYAGAGTLVIQKIISYFREEAKRAPEEDEILGIDVHAMGSAVPFYLKNGFKRVGSHRSTWLVYDFMDVQN